MVLDSETRLEKDLRARQKEHQSLPGEHIIEELVSIQTTPAV